METYPNLCLFMQRPVNYSRRHGDRQVEEMETAVFAFVVVAGKLKLVPILAELEEA